MDRRCRQIELSTDQRQELIELRNTAPKAYLRERCAAILKVADGMPISAVAEGALLRVRDPDTLSQWLDRYQEEGTAGLYIRPGRGRKPAFSPCAL
jgi:transposase